MSEGQPVSQDAAPDDDRVSRPSDCSNGGKYFIAQTDPFQSKHV